MTNEIIEIIKSLSPEAMMESVKTLKPEDIIMRLQNGQGNLRNHINTYKYLKFRIHRLSRIAKVKNHNKRKKNFKK